MQRRKIQLIAGMTYTISLPKEWVKKNNLKEKDELTLNEKSDQTLVISPHEIVQKKLMDISLNIDSYTDNIDQILFAIYYIGAENITLFSKKELIKDVKGMIRKTLTYMSGTEISYEDEQKIIIKVLLDKSKIDIIQILYRINLIIEMSILNILEQLNIDEIRINENEIDRLYHLMVKLISISLIDANILHTSKIMSMSLIPSYFLISKRLENLGDDINYLSQYLYENKIDFKYKKETLNFLKTELSRSIRFLLRRDKKVFEKIDKKKLEAVMNNIFQIKNVVILDYLKNAVRRVVDINEEVINISFYEILISDGLL